MWSVCFGAWRSRCCRLVPWTRFVRFSEGRAALIGAEPHKKGACSHHKAHVPMPSVPRACLAVIKAHIILGAQETFLDCPAQPGGGGQFRQCRVRAGISEVIRDGLRITQASAYPAAPRGLRLGTKPPAACSGPVRVGCPLRYRQSFFERSLCRRVGIGMFWAYRQSAKAQSGQISTDRALMEFDIELRLKAPC